MFMDFVNGNRSNGICCVERLLLVAEVMGFCGQNLNVKHFKVLHSKCGAHCKPFARQTCI